MKKHALTDTVQLPEDVTVVDRNGKRRTVHLLVKENKAAPVKYEVTIEFDFTKCTDGDLLRLAARSCAIAWQARMRGDWAEFVKSPSKYERRVEVKSEICDAERVKKSDFQKALDFAGKLSPEELVKFLAAVKPGK